LGGLYDRGRGVKQDAAKATRYFKLALDIDPDFKEAKRALEWRGLR
jgi:TPR repeat protein